MVSAAWLKLRNWLIFIECCTLSFAILTTAMESLFEITGFPNKTQR
jgi:hypothetical protein